MEIISIEANPKLVITDLSGKIKSTFHIIQNQDSYDLNQLENGIYICIISNDKGIITTKKLVILK